MPVKELNEESKAKWNAFVSTLGKPADEVADALAGVVGDITDDAVALLGNADDTPDADIKAALVTKIAGSVPTAIANKAIRGIRDVVVPAAPAPVANGSAGARHDTTLLANVVDDSSILDLLRMGGVAKMTPEDLIVAVRGAFVRSVSVDRIIPTLLSKMRERAEALDEPLGTTYFKLLKASRRRAYADVLAAFDGAVTTVADAEKQTFLDKVDTLWPSLKAFQAQLDSYRQLHKDESADVGNIVAAIRLGGTAVEYPDPSQVIAAARGIIDRFNRVFGGMGIPAARAIGKDLAEEAELLRNPELPAALGSGSFEEMVKTLGLGVPTEAKTTELSIAKFVLNLLKLPDQPQDQQPEVILALQRLGKPIDWPTGRVTNPVSNGRGGTPRDGRAVDGSITPGRY